MVFTISRIDEAIMEKALAVCCPQPALSLFESQVLYWFSAKQYMIEGGYELLIKHMPGISKPLAEQLAKSTNGQLIALSHKSICPLKHMHTDKAIENLLLHPKDKNAHYSAMLQLLANK